jgi:hypothetical protein
MLQYDSLLHSASSPCQMVAKDWDRKTESVNLGNVMAPKDIVSSRRLSIRLVSAVANIFFLTSDSIEGMDLEQVPHTNVDLAFHHHPPRTHQIYQCILASMYAGVS